MSTHTSGVAGACPRAHSGARIGPRSNESVPTYIRTLTGDWLTYTREGWLAIAHIRTRLTAAPLIRVRRASVIRIRMAESDFTRQFTRRSVTVYISHYCGLRRA